MVAERVVTALRASGVDAVETFADALRRSPLRRAVQWRRHRGLEPADAFLASYPRSGNTWLRFVLAQLMTAEPADFVSIDRVCPGVGVHRESPRLLPGAGRLVKTHEPWRPEYGRALYLIRDPRDVVVSWYSLLTRDPSGLEGLDEFVRDFVRGRVVGYGSWQDHVRGWLTAAEGNPLLRVERFETMRADLPRFVARSCAFLGIEAGSAQIDAAIADNSKERMRELERQGLDYLRTLGWRSQGVRKGAVGTWREVLTERHMRELRPALELAAQLGYEI